MDDEAECDWAESVSLAFFPVLSLTGSWSSWMILCLDRSIAACSVPSLSLFLVASDTVVCRMVYRVWACERAWYGDEAGCEVECVRNSVAGLSSVGVSVNAGWFGMWRS